jgi:asparagine synthase (glutamine-hydrolysing)
MRNLISVPSPLKLMPGIVGLVTKMPRQQAERQLFEMMGALRHEEFYVTGFSVEESLGLYVGWVAREGSFADGMPLRNERGDVVLTFAGEEFPDPNTARRLKEQGHEFGSEGPAYLPHLYEEDPSFFAGLNGRFHGLLGDRKRGTATLFNDRMGMQRVYYHQSKDAFYFAAEAKAILAVRPELRRLNSRALGEFVSCGAVLEDRTLFEGVHTLPPASAWVFRNGALESKGSYFQPREWEEQETLEPEAYYRELRETFTQNLPRYFGGQEGIAMSLTGGLDTRMIMAWERSEPGAFPCYTFGSMYRENHDVRIARRVAQACGQPFQVITAGKDFLSRFSHYAERAVYLADGCADVSRSPDVYLNEQAREIAPVRMTGNFGGEVLRRVRTFKPVDPLPGLFRAEFLSYVREARETYEAQLSGHPLSFTVFKQGPWNHYGILALEQTQLSLRTPFLDNDLIRTVYRAPDSAMTSSRDSLRLIADGKNELLRIPTDRGLAGEKGTLLGAADRGLLEFSFKAEYAYDMGMPQGVARIDHAFSAFHLERLFLGRHKVFHFRVWYRDALAGYVRDTLLDPQSLDRPYLERKSVEQIVRGHLTGSRNYTNEIHKMITLELVQRLFVDASGVAPRNGLSEASATTVATH